MFLMAPVQSPTNSNNSAQATDSNTNKSPVVQKYLTNCKSLYSCIYCRTHLADHDELVSRSFQGNHGRAYLFNSVLNIYCGAAVQRALNTGSHAVADIFCNNCDTTLGWKYEKAYVEEQKYKEGKYIIELAHVVRENRHLELDKGQMLLSKRMCQPHRSSASYTSSVSSPSPSQSSSSASSPSNTASASPKAVGECARQENTARCSMLHEKSAGRQDDGDEDEDLMFPFYDELCSSGPSYPSSYSYSQHNRIRRSLYMESTPYDWKFAGSSSSNNNDQDFQQQQEQHCSPRDNMASSLGTSCVSSWSSSATSSSSNSPPRQSSYQHDYDGSQSTYKKCINVKNSELSINKLVACDVENDTQFKFEADKLDSEQTVNIYDSDEEPGSSENEENKQKLQQHCDHMTSNSETNSGLGKRGTNSNISNLSENNGSRTSVNKVSLPETSNNICRSLDEPEPAPSNLDNSMSLDDEEFYDCYTEHELASPTKA